MDISIIMITINCVLIGVLLIFVLALAKKISAVRIEELSDSVTDLSNRVKKAETELNEIKIRLEAVSQKSERESDVFKRVVYGLDFIVQGCKKALEIKDIESVEKKLDFTFKNLIAASDTGDSLNANTRHS